jgi:uncharacterized protein involved in tellurium resistance
MTKYSINNEYMDGVINIHKPNGRKIKIKMDS